MPEQAIKDKTAITGIGWTNFSRNSGTTVLNLAAEACLNAIADAGLTPKDIDGVVTYFWVPDTVTPPRLVEALGIERCNFAVHSQLGGSWSCGAVACAVLAVHGGLCRNVLVYRAMNARSGQRMSNVVHNPSGAIQFTSPYGVSHAAASFGHHATAHMARFGTTTEDFGHVAVMQRKHAMLNTKAVMRQPMTLEDHQNSRLVVYPLRLLDCCIETDGATAIVVSAADQARDCKHAPVYVMSAMAGEAPVANLWETNGVNAAPLLYEGAGITPADVDFAELYDPFTFMCMTHMEDFGLVPKGEVGAWVRAGNHGLDGPMPVNTHGGLLSEVYLQGLNHVVELVQQLRPEGVIDDLCQGPHTYDRTTCRQLRNPRIALSCGEGGNTSMLFRN
jgi:acetyl-CoA acetyltransferase